MNKKLNELVKEYNTVEKVQAKRLLEIFRLIKQGKGFRKVSFSNREL